jgi:SAM-dependent methyltransferase
VTGDPPTADDVPPHVQLIQMGRAFIVSRTVYAAAKLALADHLASGPKSAIELAEVIKLHAPSLHRLMRALASLGVLTEQSERRFALTRLGDALRTEAPGSARSAVLYSGSPWAQHGWDHLVYSIETGKTGFQKANGMPLYDYLAAHPEAASLFSEMMVGNHGRETSAIAAAYDFSAYATIVDVGGATGNLIAEILNKHGGPRGVLFDRPHVVTDARELLAARGVNDRVTIESGDFFKGVPPAADVYILSHIVHGWNDDQSLVILRRIRDAIKPGGRLLIVEMVLPAGDAPHPGKLLDMVMLSQVDGQERTKDEYEALLRKAGFRLSQVIETTAPSSIVEALPV